MGKKCKFLALLLAICMLATMIPTIPMEKYEASEKVSSELLEVMNISYEDLVSGSFDDDGETYSCIIWIQDVEIEEVVEAGIDAAEMTRDNHSTWSLYEYPYTTYEAEGLTYVDVEFDDTESNEYIQTYIETERDAAAELYSTNNSSFVAENFMARDLSVTYVSKYSPCVFAELSVSKITELVLKDEVVSIGYCDSTLEELGDPTTSITKDEILESIELIRVDEATDVYNVSGDGVKVGQVELYRPDVSTVIIENDSSMHYSQESGHVF